MGENALRSGQVLSACREAPLGALWPPLSGPGGSSKGAGRSGASDHLLPARRHRECRGGAGPRQLATNGNLAASRGSLVRPLRPDLGPGGDPARPCPRSKPLRAQLMRLRVDRGASGSLRPGMQAQVGTSPAPSLLGRTGSHNGVTSGGGQGPRALNRARGLHVSPSSKEATGEPQPPGSLPPTPPRCHLPRILQ